VEPLSYVLPLRWPDDAGLEELSSYLRRLSALDVVGEVIVVDGSRAELFARHAAAWRAPLRHLPPDADIDAPMGKVASVITGVRHAACEAVVIADDDVRYDGAALRRIAAELDVAELVRPQNYFSPLPWHAAWDSGRTLLNRSFGRDFPGTLAVRRSAFRRSGAYAGDVIFENLELIRTIEAGGGRVSSPLGLYVARQPPSTRHFLSQRVRQAYDDLALPARMAAFLAIAPATIAAIAVGLWWFPAAVGALAIALAELGRRREGGAAVFAARCSVVAPAWVAERAVCSWLAIASRLIRGGIPYGGGLVPRAASSKRSLERRFRAQSRAGPSARKPVSL
jgi:hypothetical protein